MRIFFNGAAHEVTGSCHFVEACGKRFLVDCGMEQGADLYQQAGIPVTPGEIDFVLLTHAHIDHSGLLPLLCTQGFKGSIYTTEATKDLCDIMLLDSAHIQEFEAEWRSRKARRQGREEVAPLYTIADASACLRLFVGIPYNEEFSPAPGISVRFTDIGHLLGSAAITVKLTENGISKSLVFSGDVGNIDQPLIKDPQPIAGGDYLIIESTYGDRSHGKRTSYIPKLTAILRDTFSRGGNLIIPSFAVGRTQEMLYFFRQIKEENLLPEFPDFEVYVDSPLAVNATKIFEKNTFSCYDENAMELIRKGINPLSFKGLKLSVTSDDSKLINFNPNPKVIISASGMCEAGRIKHHLKHNLWRPECTILFVGYQAYNTLGRSLIEGASKVKLFGEEISVLAHIEQLDGVSGHADREGLLHWIEEMQEKPSQIYVVHGEDEVTDHFASLLTDHFGIPAYAPYSGDSFDLASGQLLTQGSRLKITKKKKAQRTSDIFQKLLDAGQRLLGVIRRNEGGTNKDLAKFTSQINDLCDKWDR